MKKKPIILLGILIISALAINIVAQDAISTEFTFDGQGTLVYEVTNITRGQYEYWNVSVWDQNLGMDRIIGEIQKGDLFTVQFEHLEDLSIQDQSIAWLKTTSTTEAWEYRYSGNATFGEYPSTDAPFLYPVISIPSSYVQDKSNMTGWNWVVSQWNANPGWNAQILGQKFILEGPSIDNITAFSAEWDINTGIMQHYMMEILDEGEPASIELSFLHVRDASQWGLGWGVNQGTTLAFTVDVNTEEGLEFGGEQRENLTDGILVFMIDNLSTFEGSLQWYGSAMTKDWQQEFVFDFKDIGVKSEGPRVWYPFIPIGNGMYISNITAEFEGTGATVINDGQSLTVLYNDDFGYENATWDLASGIMKSMSYQGIMSNETEIWVTMDFAYAIDGGKVDMLDSFQVRYIVDDIQNGSRNYLNFGKNHDEYGNEYGQEFYLYEGDIFAVEVKQDMQYNRDDLLWFAKTSSGYMTEGTATYMPPGLEGAYDGPPLFYFAIPTANEKYATEDWFVMLEDAFSASGYQVSNTADNFGVTATVDSFQVEVQWNKTDGIMSYYNVQGTTEKGDTIKWEMHRGIALIDPSSLGWGVQPGTTMEYVFTQLSEPLPFGEAGSINEGESFSVTIDSLGDFSDGSFTSMTLKSGDQVINDVELRIPQPGFEFTADYSNPFFYFIIPVGSSADFQDWTLDIYREAGYTVNIIDDILQIRSDKNNMTIVANWDLQTGIMKSYEFNGQMSEGVLTFTIVLESSSIPSQTSGTSVSDNPSPNPLPMSDTVFLAIPLLAVVWKKKKKLS